MYGFLSFFPSLPGTLLGLSVQLVKRFPMGPCIRLTSESGVDIERWEPSDAVHVSSIQLASDDDRDLGLLLTMVKSKN